tara:strand:+ start:615 stop:1628 length:1014 start_codon:yes stop_codon:yes gene_type:complete
MKCKNESGKIADWWFIYKMPMHVGSKENNGSDYLYYDEDCKALQLSENTLEDKKGALYNTLNEVFNSKDENDGYIIYNDENPDGDRDQQKRGHCKGILAFNKTKNTGTVILHSVPRFPFKGELDLPKKELKYGQTFLCVELSGFDVVEEFAAQMLKQQNPEVGTKDSFLPKNIAKTDALYKLYHELDIDESVTPSVTEFKSKAGKDFSLIAKSKAWNDDFWIDLVGPTLKVDMEVETWRRGPVTPSHTTKSEEEILDVIQINLSNLGLKDYHWKYTQDHSKWGVATKKADAKNKWVCIADINAMISQEKRGGGGIAFKEPKLWDSLVNMVEEFKEEV